MRVSSNHHPAFRVADIDGAARFYIAALGGHWRRMPVLMEGDEAVLVMGGTPGCRFKVAHIGFDEGIIELFEFLEPVTRTGPIAPAEGGIIHYAFYVDDVPEALERVERLGGRRYWPEIRDMPGGFQVIYVTDPDGNVIELIDIRIEDLVDVLNEHDPGNAPALA
jgi:glyoxylase I family protein